jgi:hypothetical protein
MARKKSVTNIDDLRYRLSEKFAALENGEIDVAQAKAYTGLAAQIINSCKVQLMQQDIMGVAREIEYLKNPSELKAAILEVKNL